VLSPPPPHDTHTHTHTHAHAHTHTQEWEEEQKRRQEALTKGWNPDGELEGDEDAAGANGSGDEGDDLPFACYICREVWAECKSDPVVTKCKHYFCEACALK
jgi:RING finger protein 113A